MLASGRFLHMLSCLLGVSKFPVQAVEWFYSYISAHTVLDPQHPAVNPVLTLRASKHFRAFFLLPSYFISHFRMRLHILLTCFSLLQEFDTQAYQSSILIKNMFDFGLFALFNTITLGESLKFLKHFILRLCYCGFHTIKSLKTRIII